MPLSRVIIFLLFSLLGGVGEQVLSCSGSKMVGTDTRLSVFVCSLAAGTLGPEVLKERGHVTPAGAASSLFLLVGRMAKI